MYYIKEKLKYNYLKENQLKNQCNILKRVYDKIVDDKKYYQFKNVKFVSVLVCVCVSELIY